LNDSTSEDERSVLVDQYTAADIVFQIEQLLQTSPLILLVNPKDFSVSYSPVQNFQNRSREGYIFERWGESQPTISFSGSTGAFIAASNPNTATGWDPNSTETDSVSGLQFASKRDSAAWQNFMSLFHFYQNNGYIFDLIRGTEANLFIGAVAIDYDQFTYVGHITNLKYSYDENMPHRVEWSCEFTCDRLFDNSEAPIVVLPMQAPTPNPSWPGKQGARPVRPDSPSPVAWGDPLDLSFSDFGSTPFTDTVDEEGREPDDPGYDPCTAEVPLDLFFPSGVT
jgi:hypothetical protein